MDRAEQLKIFARSLGDPIYAIETFLKTFDLTQKGNVPFKLYYKQKEIINSYEKHNTVHDITLYKRANIPKNLTAGMHDFL